MPRKKKEEVKVDPRFLDPKWVEKELQKLYPLHDGQLLLRKKIDAGFKRVQAQCGRNWGKSVWISSETVRHACKKQNQHCFIICPNKVQAKEIYWDSGLLLSMIPKELLSLNFLGQEEKIKTELRIRLKNGSFIKLLGADDPDALRGIKPHFCAYDEYRDFREGVYWNMEANLAGKNATLIIGSTPPDVVGHYSELRAHIIKEAALPDTMYFYLELPTETNPHIDKKLLADIKRRLITHGQLRVWEREYMAKFIPGGASSVFPMFAEKKEEIVKPSFLVEELVKNDKDVLEFYCAFDPATSSVFAVLLIAINKYTSQMYILDEIYERDRMKTGSMDIWNRARAKQSYFYKKLDKWENFYDEHEAWFLRDLEKYEALGVSDQIEPTQKASRSKEDDLSIIKDLMLLDNRLIISDKCVNLIEEIESYATDKNGKLVKKKDHLIDDWRYIIAGAGFMLTEQPNYQEYLDRKQESKVMVEGFDKFIDNRRKQEVWEEGIDESAYLTDDVVFLEDISYGIN